MTAATIPRQPELAGQTVVLIGGSAGMGLATARRARAEGADVVLTGSTAASNWSPTEDMEPPHPSHLRIRTGPGSSVLVGEGFSPRCRWRPGSP